MIKHTWIIFFLLFMMFNISSFAQSSKVALLVNNKSTLDANEQMIISIASANNVTIDAIDPQNILNGTKHLSDYAVYFCVSMTAPTGWLSGMPLVQLTNQLYDGKHLCFNDAGSYIPEQLGLGSTANNTWNPSVRDACYFIASRRPVHPAFRGMSPWTIPVNLSQIIDAQKIWQVNSSGSYTFIRFNPDTTRLETKFRAVELVVTDGVDVLNINPALCNEFGAQCTKQRALFENGTNDLVYYIQTESNYGPNCGSCVYFFQPRLSIGTFGIAGFEYVNNLFHYYSSIAPKIKIDNLNNVCTGDTATLDAGDGYTRYRWSTGDTTRIIKINQPGKYSVMVQDSNRSCTRNDTVTIASASSSISYAPQREINPGETIEVTVRLESSMFLTYLQTGFYTTYLRYNKKLLRIDVPNASYQDFADERVLKLQSNWTGNLSQGILSTIPAMVMLADSDHAAITLDSVVWSDGVVCSNYINQKCIIPIKICREGGNRLINTTGTLSLSQNRPNPYNAMTTIEFEIIEKGRTQLFALDMLGRRLTTIVDAELTPGRYQVSYDATQLSSGTYFYVLQTPTKVLFKMMQVLK